MAAASLEWRQCHGSWIKLEELSTEKMQWTSFRCVVRKFIQLLLRSEMPNWI